MVTTLIQINWKGKIKLLLMFCLIHQGWFGYCGKSKGFLLVGCDCGFYRGVFLRYGVCGVVWYSSGSIYFVGMLCSPLFALVTVFDAGDAFIGVYSTRMARILSRQRGIVWALILGCAAIFRYSGLTMIPLLMAWVWFNRPTNGWKMLLRLVYQLFFCVYMTFGCMENGTLAYDRFSARAAVLGCDSS